MPQPLPRLFIGSSSEGSSIAHNLQSVLEQRSICEATVWDQGVFEASGITLDSLLNHVANTDFAVLVASPDDVTVSRKQESASVRDNIILELGICIGELGRERTYLLATGDVKLPSDLLGLTRLPFTQRSDGNLTAAVSPAALQIENRVKTLQHRERTPQPTMSQPPGALGQEIALLCANAEAQGWQVRTNSPTTLRLRSPRGRTLTLSKSSVAQTREELRDFVRELRSHGLRVNGAVRRPIAESPFH